jgi:hypothetical protein
MRKTPIYSLDCGLGEWLEKNNSTIFNEVLESTEAAIEGEYQLSAIPVVILQSESGTTLFALKSVDATRESLEKAMTHFVDSEEYEKAARARDAKAFVEGIIKAESWIYSKNRKDEDAQEL